MKPGEQSRSALIRKLQSLRAEVRELEGELYPGSGNLPSELPSHAPVAPVALDVDVSCRALAPFVEALGQGGRVAAGVDGGAGARVQGASVLLQGVRLSAEELANPDEWIPWDQFCVVCRNIRRRWSDNEADVLARQLIEHRDLQELAPLASVMGSVLELYEWGAHQLFGPTGMLFRCVRFDVETLRDGCYGLQITLPESYRHNPLFFRMMKAWLEALPGLAGREQASVTMEAIPGGAAYDIRLDAFAPSARAGAVRRGVADVDTLRRVHELLVERNRQLERHDVERDVDMRALREGEKRFRILSELTNDYCFLAQLVDTSLVCEWITGSHTRITGYGSGELLLMGVHGIVHAEDRAGVTRALGTVERGESVQHEYRILTRDGEVRWVREHLRPEVFADGTVGPVYGAVRDVTERHHAQREQQALEEQLRQSQKMDAVGRLAGGIAHDFNNLLTVIITHVGFLLRELKEHTQAHDDATDIQQAARRAAGLTQRLLTFSRQQVITPTVLELNLVVRDLEPMLHSLVGEGIELDIQLDPRQSCISMDRAQLEQILLNLVVNARDAMDQGGRVTIATGEIDLGEAFVKAHPDARPGRHVALGVRDTGCGMDERTLGRIFEPFFSTKPPDKGTGLGLSTVYGIVRQAGGSINVESQQGFGTTFEIYFPVTEGAMDQDPSVRPNRLESRHRETILVVEDEEGVRRGVQRILKHAGYEVLVAADPAQAITIVEEYDGPLDLLLTDVVMPMMNGVQLAERVTAMRNDVRVLYMSGYTSDSVDTGAALDEEIAFLHKPFTRRAMLAKVSEVLGGPQESEKAARASG